MQDSLQGINWTFIEAHLPTILFVVVAVPLSLLLWADVVKISARNRRKSKTREVRVLSRMRQKDGSPIYMTIFGENTDTEPHAAPVIDFESRRVAAVRAGRTHQWR